MNRILIGGIIFFSGLLVTLGIIIAGVIYATNIDAWSGSSKLGFAIFDEPLFLGFPFVIGIVFTLLGVIILVDEYRKNFLEKR